MNLLSGEIEDLRVKSSLTLVNLKVGQTRLTTIVIDTPETAPYLRIGNSVTVIFKETEVIIGKGTEHHISLQNKLVGTILSIESGDLLSRLAMDTDAGKVVSVITTNAVNQLQLKPGTQITAMIKTNEIMLTE